MLIRPTEAKIHCCGPHVRWNLPINDSLFARQKLIYIVVVYTFVEVSQSINAHQPDSGKNTFRVYAFNGEMHFSVPSVASQCQTNKYLRLPFQLVLYGTSFARSKLTPFPRLSRPSDLIKFRRKWSFWWGGGFALEINKPINGALSKDALERLSQWPLSGL